MILDARGAGAASTGGISSRWRRSCSRTRSCSIPTRTRCKAGFRCSSKAKRSGKSPRRRSRRANADVIDCKGRTLMPGLIDCHVHVMLSEVNIRYLEAIPLTMMTVRAASLMRAMIDRGFTTVRDTGGADWGMRDGVAQGLLPGPRMFIAGRALGPTGGHSDARRRTDHGTGACQLLQRDELLPGSRRRRRRRARGGARAASPGRRPDQDHGVGRRGEPL